MTLTFGCGDTKAMNIPVQEGDKIVNRLVEINTYGLFNESECDCSGWLLHAGASEKTVIITLMGE